MKTILLSLMGSLSIMTYSQTITPGTISDPGNNWCPGGPVVVPYTITGIFNPGNMFILQMSDDGGTTFTSPQNVDTIVGISSGTFNSIIPMGTSWTSRSFRITSSDPVVISAPSNTIFLQFTPMINFTTPGPFCLEQPLFLESDQYATWTGPNGFSATNTSQVFINNPTYADSGMYTVTITNAHACTNSDTIHVTLNTPPSVSFNYPGSDTICKSYGIQILTGGTPAGGTYSGQWVSGNSFDPFSADTTALTNIVYTYTAGNGCSGSDTVAIMVLGCAGIEENDQPSIVVYPNPFTNSISIDGIENVTVRIINTMGQGIYYARMDDVNHVINTELLLAGIYYLQVGELTKKIIKQ